MCLVLVLSFYWSHSKGIVLADFTCLRRGFGRQVSASYSKKTFSH